MSGEVERPIVDIKAIRGWLLKHRPDRPGGTGMSAQAWMDLAELFAAARAEESRDTAERIAQAIERTGEVCTTAHGNGCVGGIAYRDAARIAREATS